MHSTNSLNKYSKNEGTGSIYPRPKNVPWSSASYDNIAFVGLTHLGLVSSICTSSMGIKVLAISDDIKAIRNLSKGKIGIPEPGLEKLLVKSKKNYYLSDDFSLISNASIVFISLDTPTDKPFNIKGVNRLIDKVIPYLNVGSILVVLSQVSVGFCRRLKTKIKSKIDLYYFLNTLIIGDSVNRFLKPERIVLGKDKSKTPVNSLLKKFLDKFNCPIFEMSYESAELTKSAINLYLASSIITTNTLSDFCEKVGADFNEIVPALKSDKRIGQFAYLKPTLRISGGHLEREMVKLKSLSDNYQLSASFIDSLIRLNNNRLKWLSRKINQLSTKSKPIKKITLWGLSYKKDSESTYNAPSVEIIKRFSGRFNFQVYDPKAKLSKNLPAYKRFRNKYSALNKSDLLIILTDWDEFRDVNYSKTVKLLNNPFIIDCTGIIKEDLPIIRMGSGRSFLLP